MTRTAFVTGATGFLGLNLVEHLGNLDWRIVALHRQSSDLRHLKNFDAELAAGDITDPESLAQAMPEEPDAVFHVAGSLNLWSRRNEQQDRINIQGTRNVVEAALEKKARRFVHTSTISVYGLQKGRIEEDSPRLGRDSWINYQRSKFHAEEEVRKGISRGLDAVILNPASIVGAYDTRGWARFIRMLHEGTLPGVPPGAQSFCWSRQVAKAHAAAVDKGRKGDNYLLGGCDATFLELVQTIGEVADLEVPKKPTPAWVLKIVARLGQLKSRITGKEPRLTPEAVGLITRNIHCDSTKAQRELGYETAGLKTMVQDSHLWLKAQGYV